MNEAGENDRDARPHAKPGSEAAEPDCPARGENARTLGLETALEKGQVDFQDVVRWLADRLAATESRLARIGQRMDQMTRRMSRVETRMASLTSQASDHEENLRMIGTILRDLDDPYGFGLSLDQRISCDGSDGTSDEPQG